jgi:hypothetical protein
MLNDPELRAVIITSKIGNERITKSGHPISPNTSIEVLSETTTFNDQDFRNIAQILFEKYNVKFLDVTAGGVVIGTFTKLKYPIQNLK